MSSSDRPGTTGKAVAADRGTVPTPVAADGGPAERDDDAPADPWFTPGPKRAAEAEPEASDALLVPAGGADGPAVWFLPAGRAGLLPDSMTEPVADGTLPGAADPAVAESASTPPWGAEPTTATGTPPPWENGPWPGPGDRQQASRRPDLPTAAGDLAQREAEAASARRRPLQLALGAAAATVVLIVLIVVIVTATSGSPTGGCAQYPAAVRQAYVSAMTDLRTHAPLSVQSAAFAQAASRANGSAAAAGQITVRTALFTMASDLDQAHTDMTAHRALPAALVQHLTADGTALPASCPS
jgi:hypothetical protein